MKNIFVTGISGMLGSNIAHILRDRYNVFGVDLSAIEMDRVCSYQGSIFDVDVIKECLIRNNIEVFIHCAALVNVDECEECPDYAHDLNYAITKKLADMCAALNVKFVFISTDAVFDGRKMDYLYTEEDPTAPISVYGKTKAQAEESVLVHDGNLVIRTNIYGYNYQEKNSFGEWVISALQSGEQLNMFYDIFFSPILVNELTEVLDVMLQRDVSGLYHVCSTGSICKYDMGCLFKKYFGGTGTITKGSMKDHQFKGPRTQNMGLDNTKIRELLGIHISTPEESVKRFKQLYDEKYGYQLKSGK